MNARLGRPASSRTLGSAVGGQGDFGIPSSAGAPRRAARNAVVDGGPIVDGTATGVGDANSVSSSGPTVEDVAANILPIAKALLAEDATTDVEVIKARLRNHMAMRDTYPRGSILWKFYDNKVHVLEAKLRGARVVKNQEMEDRESKREWAFLGKTGVVTGIFVGGAIIYLLSSLSGAARRHAGSAGPAGPHYRGHRKARGA